MASKKREISIIERRLKSGSIFSAGSKPIPLVDPKTWTIRIVNTEISDARSWDMQSDKGWVYLERADLAVEPHEIGFRELDGRIVRGTRGQEVLMKMKHTDYKQVQILKEATNRKNTFSPQANKAAIVNAASAQHGDQAADLLNRAVQTMEIKDSVERVSLEE
jgi:hypothetical protein